MLSIFFFRKFATELRSLIYVIIWFLLHILRTNRQIETKYCLHIIIDKIYNGIVNLCCLFCKFTTELRPLIDVRLWFLLHILRMNGQNLTKFCILIITDKIYVGIVKHHQFFKNSYVPVFPCPLIVLRWGNNQIL